MTEHLLQRIPKELEDMIMLKLPKELEDKIRWMATEPTPSAKIMKAVRIVIRRVFPHSDFSPFGPGKKCVIHVELRFLGATLFRDPRAREKTFAIKDIPLDLEPTSFWWHDRPQLPQDDLPTSYLWHY